MTDKYTIVQNGADWNAVRLGILKSWAQAGELVRVRYAIATAFEEELTGVMIGEDAYEFGLDLVERGGVMTGVERVRAEEDRAALHAACEFCRDNATAEPPF